MNDYGIKELYSVALKATYNMEVNGKIYEEGETILRFDKIQIASLSEVNYTNAAMGGKDNKTLITWDNTKEVHFVCSEGVLSRTSLSILSNSKLIDKTENEVIPVPILGEEIEPENGVIKLKHMPNGTGFIYSKETGEKLYSQLNQQTYPIQETVIADYYYDYGGDVQTMEVGNKLFKGYVKLEGKMRLKDDTDGHDKTVIVEIPRIKIASSLALRLGRNSSPTVGNFSFIGYPVGLRGSQKVCYLHFLNDDIDSDF